MALLQIISLRENCYEFPRPKINVYINKHTLATPKKWYIKRYYKIHLNLQRNYEA